MREIPRGFASAGRRPRRSAPRAPSPSGAGTRCESLDRFTSPPFSGTSGAPQRPRPQPSSTGVLSTTERRADRRRTKPPAALPTSTAGILTQTQPNPLLQLTNTDAAQSVILPLCLLSVFAAEQHVRGMRGNERLRMHQPCVVMLPEGGVVPRRAGSMRPQAARFAGAFSRASESGVFRSTWAASRAVLLRPAVLVNLAAAPWGRLHRRSPYLGPSTWTVGGSVRPAQRASRGGSRVSTASVLVGRFRELVASTHGLFLRGRGVLSTGSRTAFPPSPLHLDRSAGAPWREETLPCPFTDQRVAFSGEPCTSSRRRGQTGTSGLTGNWASPEFFCNFRRLDATPNWALQLTNTNAAQSVILPLCLLSVFAAEQHVGLLERV